MNQCNYSFETGAFFAACAYLDARDASYASKPWWWRVWNGV